VVLSPDDAPRGRGFDSRSVTFPPPGFDTTPLSKPHSLLHFRRSKKQCPSCRSFRIASHRLNTPPQQYLVNVSWGVGLAELGYSCLATYDTGLVRFLAYCSGTFRFWWYETGRPPPSLPLVSFTTTLSQLPRSPSNTPLFIPSPPLRGGGGITRRSHALL